MNQANRGEGICDVWRCARRSSHLQLPIANCPLLIGGSWIEATILLIATPGTFLGGVALSLIFRSTKPEIYPRIGRKAF